jgi:hypothetical protein
MPICTQEITRVTSKQNSFLLDISICPKLGWLFFVTILAVVYQKPKLSAETESFHLSAFGFGRRNYRLNMAEYQISEKKVKKVINRKFFFENF